MVIRQVTASLITLALATPPAAFAQVSTPLKSIKLSQKEAAELALNNGTQSKEINLSFLQKRLAPAQVLTAYDWTLMAQTGFEKDRLATFNSTTSDYDRFTTTAQLKKSFITGTALTFDYSRISQQADGVNTSFSVPAQATLDSFGITLEQSLLANSLGKADRAKVRAAETQFKADSLTRADQLEDLVLQTLAKYWNTYVAQENFKESLAARDQYKKLVDNVKRKSSYGYSNPGELTQVQAELEGREQNVKRTSLEFLSQLDGLIVWLNLEKGTQIEFSVPEKLPAIPAFDKKDIAQLREVRAQEMKIKASKDLLSSSQSASWPAVNFVGQFVGSGRDESSEGSWSRALTGSNNKYYAGIKVTHTFGSDIKNEDVINKKASLDIERSKLYRQIQESTDKQEQAIRKVQATFSIVGSAAQQKSLREKTVNELNRTYNQGRTDIKALIDAMNAHFTSQVAYTRALGDYYIALNEWAAIRDELIPEINDENAINIKEDFE